MKRIEVAVGIVYNADGRILVGQRTVKDRYYQQWEFPGGKLESGESAQQALVREFAEEVGISITHSEPLMELEHDYPDRHVHLYIQEIKHYNGDPKPMEGQSLRWVKIDELRKLDFLQGNQSIINKLENLYS